MKVDITVLEHDWMINCHIQLGISRNSAEFSQKFSHEEKTPKFFKNSHVKWYGKAVPAVLLDMALGKICSLSQFCTEPRIKFLNF